MNPRQLSKHFIRAEFECACGCGFDTVDAELITAIEDAHSHFHGKYKTKTRIIITGGNRCIAHNEVVQQRYNPNYVPFSSKSFHIMAKAADFRVEVRDKKSGKWARVPADQVADYLEDKYPDCYGIGRYRGVTHLDVRDGKARWDKR